MRKLSVCSSAQLTFWPGASHEGHAKTSALQERAPASTASAPDCGPRCSGSCEKCDPVGASLKTSLLSELAALTGYSATWSRRATPHGRSWWVLTTSARRTAESASGSWPTAAATPYGTSNNGCPGDGREEYATKGKPSLETMARQSQSAWPTATAGDANASGSRITPTSKAHPGVSLTDAIVRGWATPRAEDSESAGAHRLRGPAETLTAQTRAWPSPQAHDEKNLGENTPGHSPQLRHLPGLLAQGNHSTPGSPPESSPVLNPDWVATLMGYPPAWCRLTDERACARWATRSSRRSSRQSAGR